MDDASLVRGGETARNLRGIIERGGQGQRSLLQQLFECVSLVERHGDERHMLGRLADFIYGADVRVVERGDSACLREQAFFAARIVRDGSAQEFERHGASQTL